MFRNFTVTLLISLLFVSNIFGGIRGPGKYAGVVIFDQWDTCYLHSGTYVMYITEKKKELLRKYEGQSIVVDAKEVFQPMNPGDGLITKFEFLGKAEAKKNLPQIKGLKLTAAPKFETGNQVKFELEIENQSNKTIGVATSEIAPTLFGEKDKDDYFSPSDGKSEARITRCNFEDAKNWKSEKSITDKNSDGQPTTVTKSFSIEIENADSLPKSFQLTAGQKRQFIILLNVPSGNYDFLFGYGGGVHEGKSLASNIVSFSVDEKGKASSISSKAKEVKTVSIFNSDLMNLFFGSSRTKTLFSNFQIL